MMFNRNHRFFSILLLAALSFLAVSACADDPDTSKGFRQEQGCLLFFDNHPWIFTVTEPFDPQRFEYTYKVYTHIYDPETDLLLTKGPGGKFTHHRGLFIGWKQTEVGKTVYDTWHMKAPGVKGGRPCFQELVRWVNRSDDGTSAVQEAEIAWRDADTRETFIQETRQISVREQNQKRIIDFVSALHNPGKETVRLKGDPQHAGMQLRMANEVSEHENTTDYLLPEGVTVDKDDVTTPCNWACGVFEMLQRKRWILHMTAPGFIDGAPVYSIRKYGRFGAFWETEIPAGDTLTTRFRIVVSPTALTAEECAAMYQEYAGETK